MLKQKSIQKTLPTQNVSVEEMSNAVGGIRGVLQMAAISAFEEFAESGGGGFGPINPVSWSTRCDCAMLAGVTVTASRISGDNWFWPPREDGGFWYFLQKGLDGVREETLDKIGTRGR